MNERDYTFQLSAGMKTRHSAGPYDEKSRTPVYEIEVSIPAHVHHLVEIRQFLMGSEEHRFWVWEIENRSTWPAFIIMKKDGVLIRMSDGVR